MTNPSPSADTYLCDPATGEPYNSATFDLNAYLAETDVRLLASSEGRKALTRLDPLRFGLLYLPHHMKGKQTGERITLADCHLDWARRARQWVRPVTEPRSARDVFVSPRESAKPLSVESAILMGDGSRKRLGDVEVGDWVITHKGRARRVTAVHDQGKLPAVRITTRRGRVVEAALDHPFLTERGWVNAGDLEPAGGQWGVGTRKMRTCDKLVTMPSPQVVTGVSARYEEFALAGYFIGDGGATHYTIPQSGARAGRMTKRTNGLNSLITCADPVELKHIREVVGALGFQMSGPHGKYGYYIGGGARRWLEATKIAGTSSHTKRVPQWVMAAPAEKIAAFLAAYFACDGYVSATANQAIFYSVSRNLLADTQHLLLRLGIRSSLRAKTTKLNGMPYHSWALSVENIADFAAVMLPHLNSVKTERLKLATARGRFNDLDHVATVESIDPVECRCLTVDGDHTFTVEDLVVHNSTWWFLINPMWAAAHGFVRFVAAFSDSASQAEQHLATFKAELDANQLLREDFPDLVRPATRSRGSVVADRQSQIQMANGFTFAARGIDSGNLGLKVGRQRPDVLIADDIESGEANYSVRQAAKRLSTLQNVILPLSEFARCVVVGTTTMAEGLVHQCVKSVTTTEKPAEWIAEEKFDVHYYEPIIQTAEGERSIWPAKWPMSYMREVRATRSFKLNFLNQPSSANSDYWTEDDFTYGRFPVARKYLSVDGAVTTKRKSDFTGLSVVGYAPPRPASERSHALPARCLVEHSEAVKLKGAALRERALQILDAFPEIGAILVESNQGGDLWHEVFHGMPVRVITFSNSEPKEVRAGRLLNLYQLLPPRVVHAERLPALEEQMCEFPNGLNDDMIDSVGNAALRFLRPPKKQAPPSASTASYV